MVMIIIIDSDDSRS